jgi:hypothetical protein
MREFRVDLVNRPPSKSVKWKQLIGEYRMAHGEYLDSPSAITERAVEVAERRLEKFVKK